MLRPGSKQSRCTPLQQNTYFPPVCITLRPQTKMNNGRKTKPSTVSSIANGTSRLILACSHTQPNNICDMCVQGRGNKAISEVIWAESVMVQWQCFVLVVRRKKNSEASKWEWKNDKWQATQITLSWFCCVGEPRLGRLLCHAPWHKLCASLGRDFTSCSISTVCLYIQTISGNSVIYTRWLHIYSSLKALRLSVITELHLYRPIFKYIFMLEPLYSRI